MHLVIGWMRSIVRTTWACRWLAALALVGCSSTGDGLTSVSIDEWLGEQQKYMESHHGSARHYDIQLPEARVLVQDRVVRLDLRPNVVFHAIEHGWWPFSDREDGGPNCVRVWWGGAAVLDVPGFVPGDKEGDRRARERLVQGLLEARRIPYRWDLGGNSMALLVPECYGTAGRAAMLENEGLRQFVVTWSGSLRKPCG